MDIYSLLLCYIIQASFTGESFGGEKFFKKLRYLLILDWCGMMKVDFLLPNLQFRMHDSRKFNRVIRGLPF